MQQKIIIIGGGIAGLSIAYHLEKKGIDYLIIDKGYNFSSRIAAGIINPVVFRRMALSWNVDEWLPQAVHFYQELEKEFKHTFLHHTPIRRLFAHDQEIELWNKKLEEGTHDAFLSPIDTNETISEHVKNRIGTGKVYQAYWVDTKLLLDTWHQDLKTKAKLTYENFDYAAIDLQNRVYTSKMGPIAFSELIFCEGFEGSKNPFFPNLPLNPTKGEILSIKNTFLPEHEQLNYKCFVLPIGNHRFKVGSTYNWHTTSTLVTREAVDELSANLLKITPSASEIEDQEAGIRPTTIDRRPLIGTSPSSKHLHIYNGLGAKGYLITPGLALEFVDYLLEKTPLRADCDVKRIYANS